MLPFLTYLMGEKVKFTIEIWEVKIKRLRGVALILILTAISLSTVFAQQIPTPAPTGQITDADADTGIKGIDFGLVTDVGKASLDFTEGITQKIIISEEGFGEKGAIDDLITLMKVTLEFTAKVINIIQDKDMKTRLEMNLTVNETNFIDDERIEEAFQYLRFLQSEDPCREAINMMEENRTIT